MFEVYEIKIEKDYHSMEFRVRDKVSAFSFMEALVKYSDGATVSVRVIDIEEEAEGEE